MENSSVFIRVGIPGLVDTSMTVGIFTEVPLEEEIVRKHAKEFRKQVVEDFSRVYGNFGMPKEISGFTPHDFFWAVFTDQNDLESLFLCSDNFYESKFWKNPPECVLTENPFEDWWYQVGYADAKFQTDNRPHNPKNIEAYIRGAKDYQKSVAALTENQADRINQES